MQVLSSRAPRDSGLAPDWLSGRRADVWPHVPRLRPPGPHLPSAQRRALCGRTSRTSTVDCRASTTFEDGVAWSRPGMTPAGRLLIRKMDEHLREKSTLDPGSKRASLLRTTLQATLCATPVEDPTSALGEHLA